MHVRLADESVCIGPPQSSKSYLNIPSIITAAQLAGADAIPGVGFLSKIHLLLKFRKPTISVSLVLNNTANMETKSQRD